MVKLGAGVEPFYVDNGSPDLGGVRIAPGYPLFGRWSKPIVGYADANGNGVLEAGEIQLGDTAVYVGAAVPNYTAGISTTLTLWQSVTVNAQLDYQDGVAQKNTTAQALSVFSRAHQDPATTLAEQAAMADLTQGSSFNATGSTSDYNWIQTVSTTRLNSFSVSYRVPRGVTRWLGAQQLDVAIQGSNLGLWTSYRGLDPNVNAFSTGNSVTDTGVLPEPRTWQVRIHASY